MNRPRNTVVLPCPGLIIRVAEDDEARDKLIKLPVRAIR